MLSIRHILRTWWPLAASWLLMSIEGPAINAVIARLINPEINLAAYGGIVYPLALIIEAPIIMLLAASTALSKDWASYQKLRKFMLVSGGALTALHILAAFTPLYDVIVKGLLGAPAEIVEPGRIGLMIMLPWTWSIAYRRFNQGMLIRFGHSRAIGAGTLVRLAADGLVLAVGYWIGSISGIVVGALAQVAGVLSEAIYVGVVVQPVIHQELKLAAPAGQVVTLQSFLSFYIPLAMTSLLNLIANPIGSAALSRMPEALASLAAWSVASGLIFIFRSLGVAFNEVVVALLDEPRSSPALWRFTVWLAGISTLLLMLITVTPLADLWFVRVSALPPHLAELARRSLWLALPLPALSVVQSWYQGAILHSRRTRGITESVAVYMAASVIVLGGGVWMNNITGLYVGMAAFTISVLVQTAWLWLRSRSICQALAQRDGLPAPAAGQGLAA